MADIPASLDWGIVHAHIGAIISDTSDADRKPNVEDLNLTVTLEPAKVRWVRLSGENGGTFYLKDIVCSVVGGVLVDPETGEPGVPVVATNQPSAMPDTIQWVAKFHIDGPEVAPGPVLFNVAGGGAVTRIEDQLGAEEQIPYVVVVSDAERNVAIAAANDAVAASGTAVQATAEARQLRNEAEAAAKRAENAEGDNVLGEDGKLLETVLPDELTPTGLSTQIGEAVATGVADKADLRLLMRGSRTIVLGDSVDADVKGWLPYYAIQSKRILMIRNAGIGGNRTGDMLARLDTDVIAYAPDVCILGGSTNDQGQGIDESVTRSNITEMVERLLAAGITPVLRTTPPVDTAATTGRWNTPALRRQAVLRHNAWLRSFAASRGIEVLDIYQAVAEPVTGGYASGITADGIHPTEAGSKAIADYLLALPIPEVFRGGYSFARAVNDEGNMLKNGVFVGDANSDGVADSWFIASGTPTCSLTDAEVGISGNWQRITSAGATTVAIAQDILSVDGDRILYAIGDTIEYQGRVRTSGGASAIVRVAMWSAASSPTDPIASTTMQISDGAFYGRAAIPTGTTKIRVLVQLSGAAGWIEVAEVAVRNVTRLTTPPPENVPYITTPGYTDAPLWSAGTLYRAAPAGQPADMTSHPNFRFDGTPVLNSAFTDFVDAPLLTGGSSQGARYTYAVETVTAPSNKQVGVYVRNTPGSFPYKIVVDGQVLNDQAETLTSSAGTRHLILLTFPTAKSRTIRFETVGNVSFGGMVAPTGQSLSRPTTAVNRRVAIIGDSFVGGSRTPPDGASRLETGAMLAARGIGADSIWNFGIGGTGYVATENTFQTRVADVLASDPDVVIVFGSRNDGSSGSASLNAAASALYVALAGVPEVYVTGPSTAAFAGNNETLRAATQAAGRVFIDQLAEPWLVEATHIGSDMVHPNWEGHQRIGKRLADAIRSHRTS